MVKSDSIAKLNTVGARRDACGYRIQERTCASCVHCARTFYIKGRATEKIEAKCEKYDFPVNLDRGMCDDFKFFERTAQRPSLPGGTRSNTRSARAPRAQVGRGVLVSHEHYGRKTITRRTK